MLDSPHRQYLSQDPNNSPKLGLGSTLKKEKDFKIFHRNSLTSIRVTVSIPCWRILYLKARDRVVYPAPTSQNKPARTLHFLVSCKKNSQTCFSLSQIVQLKSERTSLIFLNYIILFHHKLIYILKIGITQNFNFYQ